MPNIRLYSQSLPLQRKRSIAQHLISITERVFQLKPQECRNINVQFLPPPLPGELAPMDPACENADVFVEVSDRYLTVEKMSAFVEASAPMLSSSVLTSESRHFAQVLGLQADTCLQVAFQFKVSGAAYKDAPDQSMANRKAA